MPDHETHVIRSGRPLRIIVTYPEAAAQRGARDSLGVPEEPDFDAEIDIESVTDLAGNEIETSPMEDSDIRGEIRDRLTDERAAMIAEKEAAEEDYFGVWDRR